MYHSYGSGGNDPVDVAGDFFHLFLRGGSTIRAIETNEILAAIDAEIRRLQEAKLLLDGSPTSRPAAKPTYPFGKAGSMDQDCGGILTPSMVAAQ